MSSHLELRKLLTGLVDRDVEEKEVALLLSGGVDSLSLGFAASATGRTVHAYTFQIEEKKSADSIAAERCAREMGWEFTLVKVPTKYLEDDFRRLATEFFCKKKTQFECTWPFLYVVPLIRERFVLSGIAADGHYGLSRKALATNRVGETKANFDRFRTDYFASPNPAGQVQQKRLIAINGKVQVAPYLDRSVFDFFMRYDWRTLNRPYQKYVTLLAFKDEFKRAGRRDHANLQLVAGVDTVFEGLLRTPLNTRKRSRVLDLCRDYAEVKNG